MILEGTTSSGAVVPVQVTADGKVVAEGLQGPQGPEGPEGPEGPPGPGGGYWERTGAVVSPTNAGDNITTTGDVNGADITATGVVSNPAVTLDPGTTGSPLVRDSNGRIGVGTATPGRTLHVLSPSSTNTALIQSNAAQSVIAFQDSGSTNNSQVRVGSEGNNLILFAGATEKARLDTAGRLLVGTDTSRTGGTADIIQGSHVSGSNIILNRQVAAAGSGGDYIGGIKFHSYAGSAGGEHARISCQADGNTGAGEKPGRLSFSTTPSGSTTPVERMRIDSQGDVTFQGDPIVKSPDGKHWAIQVDNNGNLGAYLVV